MSELPSGTVTFLFTDIQDSTRLWDQDPKTMSQALVRHDEIIESLTQQQNGFIVRPRGEGDSRFAVFVRAIDGVAAAAAIQRAFAAERWPRECSLSIRMGLHTGEGEFYAGDYYGTAVNRCARLRGLAHGGQTIISQSTYELVRDALPADLEVIDLGEQPLKGLQRPERVYQLIGPGLPADFPPITVAGSSTSSSLLDIPKKVPAFLSVDSVGRVDFPEKPPFVARQRELARLARFLDEVLEGTGKVVFVGGGAGRGKSTLITEFSRRAIEKYPNMLTAFGSCHAYSGVGDPYLPFRELMGMLTGDLESHWSAGTISTEHARSAWHAVPLAAEALMEHGPHLPGIFVDPKKLVSRALSASEMDASWIQGLQETLDRQPDRSDGLDQSFLFEQYTNVLRHIASQRPLLLVLDDMQWADTASLGLLFHLGRRLAGRPILVICAYRPEEVALGRSSFQFSSEQTERHPLTKVLSEFKRYFGDVVMDLGQVDSAENRAFVDEFLDQEPNHLGERFRKALITHTAGHPLFTIELLRAMQARGDLVQENGCWVAQTSLDWNTLPARIEGVIDERLSHLPVEYYELLTVASVEGVVFTPQVLARVQDISDHQLMRQLSRELEHRHRLVEEQEGVFVGDSWLGRYRFSNAMFQQYIYNNTSEGERRILHRTIGEILEELYEGYEEEFAVQLVRHFVSDRKREQHYAKLAGQQAARQFANYEALEYLSRALALTAEDEFQERYELLMAREAVYNLLGERDLQKADLEALRSLAGIWEQQGKGPGWAELETRWALYTSHTDHHEAAKFAEKSVFLAKSEDKPNVAVKAYLIWSATSRIQGDYHAAAQQVEEGLKTAREIGDRRGEGLLLNVLGLITLEQRDLIAARYIFEQALAIARQVGERQNEAQLLNNLGNTAGEEGDYSAAQSYYEKALQIAREIGNRRGECLVLGNLGWVAWQQGDVERGESYFAQERMIAQEIGDRDLEIYIAINLSILTLAQSDFETALEYARQGLDLANETGDRSGKAWALTYLGHIYRVLEKFSNANEAYQESLDIRMALNQPNLAMEPLAGLAMVSLKRGEISAAQKVVNEILGYLDEGGTLDGTEEPMRVWLTCYRVLQTAQDLRASSVLENSYQLLQERARKISDESMSRMFFENIPCHAEIMKAWKDYQSVE
ncbi:MAG: ATP-binding protein [Anaerolineales bacterium]